MASLREELESLQKKLNRRIRLQAILNSFMIIIVVLAVLAVLDNQFRPELSVIRYSLSALFWGTVCGVVFWFIIPGLFRKPDLVDIAFAIEEIQGSSPGELPAAVQFMQHSNLNSETAALENSFSQRVLQQEISEPVALRSWVFILQCSLLLSLLFLAVFSAGSDSLVAVTRIGNPKSEQKWPQLTKLEVFTQSFERISPGSIVSLVGRKSSQFYVVDQRGEPPEDVVLEVRRQSYPVKKIHLQGQSEKISGVEPKTVFGFRLVPNPKETLQFRVVGGDDYSMPWTTLLRELKPAVRTLTCQVTPPAYLKLQPRSLQNWSGAMQVPVGSELKFNMELNRPVEIFQIRDHNQVVILEQLNRSEKFAFPFLAAAASSEILNYEIWVKIDDANSQSEWTRVKRVQIEPISDLPPQVSLSHPEKEMNVTRQAVLPIQASATDDYGLHSFRIVIVSKEEFFLPADVPAGTTSSTIEGRLDVELTQAKIGETIEVYAEATDFNPNVAPPLTPMVKLHVVSQSEKEAEIIQGVKRLVTEVALGLVQQREMHSASSELFQKLKQGTISRTEKESINFLEIQQNQLTQRFQESLLNELLNSLISDFQLNKVQNQELANGLQLLQDSCQNEISPLLEESLNSLHSLQESLNRGHQKTQPERLNPAMQQQFQDLIQRQATAIQAMTELLTQLKQWTDSSDVQAQWQLLQSDLHRVADQLNTIVQQTISKTWEELTDVQQRTLLEGAKEHQLLGSRTASLIQEASQLNNTRWKRLSTLLKEHGIEDEFQKTAIALKQNNVLQGIENDQNIMRRFAEFERELSSQVSSQTTKFIEQLQKLKKHLASLVEQQALLNAKWLSENRELHLKTSQEDVRSELSQLTETIESLGMSPATGYFETYAKHVENLLVSEPEKDREQREQETQMIQQSLEQLQELLDASLDRLMKRDQDQLLGNLVELTKELTALQQSVIQRFDTVHRATEESLRLTRSQRRELLKMAASEERIASALEPFQEKFPEEHPVQTSLQAVRELTTALIAQFEQGLIEQQQLDLLKQVLTHLDTLSRKSNSAGDSGDPEMNVKIPQEILERIEKLLVQQSDLTRREQQLLEEKGALSPAENQGFHNEQAEIDATLKALFEAVLPATRE